MATTTTINTTYVGRFAGEYIWSALTAGDTLAKGVLTEKPNVKEAGITVKTLITDGILKGSTCDFTDTSTITLNERKLIVKKMQVNLQQCVELFESDWDEESMGDSAFTDLPPSYKNAIMEFIQLQVAAENENLIWNGAAGTDEYDGYLQLLEDDTAFPDAGDPRNRINGGITTANVIAKMQEAYNDIPDNVYGAKGDVQILVSYNVGKAWTNALAGFGTAGLGGAGVGDVGPVGAKPFNLNGIDIFELAGLPDDTIFIAKRSELWFGSGIMADFNTIKFLEMADIDGSQNVRMIMRLYAGVQYAFQANIVASTTAGIGL